MGAMKYPAKDCGGMSMLQNEKHTVGLESRFAGGGALLHGALCCGNKGGSGIRGFGGDEGCGLDWSGVDQDVVATRMMFVPRNPVRKRSDAFHNYWVGH
mmetsp:Transcript_139590/g.242901  ORF Transcript_139590/g.242901 Transcript_139590/m.242901 type:complete len:99 (-) Transcript_139590:898-1194(-)